MLDNGDNDVLYVDYGNTGLVSTEGIRKTAHENWSAPPFAMPFRLISK